MKKKEILKITQALTTLLNYLYIQENKKYILDIKWFENNITIFIQEQLNQNKILDITLQGNLDTYYLLVKNINSLAFKNGDAFGYLNTIRTFNNQQIRTKNFEINLPIYDAFGLLQAENNNLFLLSLLNNKKQKRKIK